MFLSSHLCWLNWIPNWILSFFCCCCCNASEGNSSQHHCLFWAQTSLSPEFSCWQPKGLFQLDKKKCPTCILTISCDETFGRCFGNAAGRVMHAQLGLIQSCDVNYGRFLFMKTHFYVITLQIQGVVSETDCEQPLPALSSCAHCSWENIRGWLDSRRASECSTAPQCLLERRSWEVNILE